VTVLGDRELWRKGTLQVVYLKLDEVGTGHGQCPKRD